MRKPDDRPVSWSARFWAEVLGEDFELYSAISYSSLLVAIGIIMWGWVGRDPGIVLANVAIGLGLIWISTLEFRRRKKTSR